MSGRPQHLPNVDRESLFIDANSIDVTLSNDNRWDAHKTFSTISDDFAVIIDPLGLFNQRKGAVTTFSSDVLKSMRRAPKHDIVAPAKSVAKNNSELLNSAKTEECVLLAPSLSVDAGTLGVVMSLLFGSFLALGALSTQHIIEPFVGLVGVVFGITFALMGWAHRRTGNAIGRP